MSPSGSASTELFDTLVIAELRRVEEIPGVALLIIAAARGAPSDLLDRSWRQYKQRKGGTLADTVAAEVVRSGQDLSTYPPGALATVKAWRALSAAEIGDLYRSRAHGSRNRLAKILNCSRRTASRRVADV
jgi:hypothetical protein